MATAQPPRKKRKLLKLNHSICNGSSKSNTNTNNTRVNVDDLMQLIENEPNQMIEMNVLKQIINTLKTDIDKNKANHALYLKLSWAYLRSGQYNEAISYFNNILPHRDHDKFYDIESLTKTQQKKTKNDKHHHDTKNTTESDQDSDLEISVQKKKKRKRKKQRKKYLKKLKQFELNRPRLNKNKIHYTSNSNDTDTNTDKEVLIPFKYEISIRVNIGLMLCRICDFEEALRQCYIIRELYIDDFKSNEEQIYPYYDPYVDFIQMLVVYHQKHWHQCIETALKILQHQDIKISSNNKKHQKLICELDNHSLFELYCVLGDSYSSVGKLKKADHIFEDIILPHIVSKCGDELDLSLKFHWIYEIYLRHLYNKNDFAKGYTLCMKLFSSNISYRYNANMMRLCEMFNVQYHFDKTRVFDDEVYHFVLDAEYFGNQCRFVNHSDDVDMMNCMFVVRYTFGNTSCPSPIEVWLKSTKKIDKNDELLVNYGKNYWKNVHHAPTLKNRKKWDEGFVFTHLVVDEMGSYLEMKNMIERHHVQNTSLVDKMYPNCIDVKNDKYGGFGCFANKTIKKDTFILRYAGIRKLSTDHDQSHSRYAIEVRNYGDTPF